MMSHIIIALFIFRRFVHLSQSGRSQPSLSVLGTQAYIEQEMIVHQPISDTYPGSKAVTG